ncbi:MAG TPA: hypothetical protein VFX98_07610 [Longimicrobiaceae bacterium]|nr:hypothetical protein [Longimicrobiaceae bacterium]
MRLPALKALLIYAALVGGPVAGLLGILHLGSRLQAPPPLGEAWRTVSLATLRGTLLTPAGGALPALEVQQSGVYLSVAFDGARFAGRLHGDSLVARSRGRAPAVLRAECGAETPVELRATFDRAAVPHRLSGVLAVEGRPECPRAFFTAERVR